MFLRIFEIVEHFYSSIKTTFSTGLVKLENSQQCVLTIFFLLQFTHGFNKVLCYLTIEYKLKNYSKLSTFI